MPQKIALFFKKFWFRIVFFTAGLGSLIWLLIRVIPKPSRINYPCMKAATPIAYSFLAYLLSLGTFTFIMKKARERFKQSKYVLAGIFVFIGIAAGIITIINTQDSVLAATTEDLQPPQAGNEPIGEAKGIFPGRVVWEHDADATNKDCSNSSNDYWYMDKNTDQGVVNIMLSEGLQHLTGTATDAEAWDAIFRSFNITHGRGDNGYQAGEKISIKINLNGRSDDAINTSPQICHALLNQLVNVVGVAETNIHLGDTYRSMNEATYNKLYPDFKDVYYWGSGAGLTSPVPSASKVLKYSDGNSADYLPQSYLDATYLINVPVFKKHHRGGISICSKNHFGSMAPFTGGASHLHYSLPCPEATGEAVNGNYGVYRCFVDIMGHKDLGGKTVLYLVDGIWGSTNWGHPPIKFRMAPFNDDWPNSMFLSQDPVAIESVCYDFLYSEFDENHPTEGLPATADKGPFARFPGTDDFLHQAANPDNWPAGINYDPEGDGSVLGSLGAHEHWNNATDKQYSRNLGTGNGIDLKSSYVTSISASVDKVGSIRRGFKLYPNFPNPLSETTTIYYHLDIPSSVQLRILNSNGQLIKSIEYDERKVGKYSYIWDGSDSNNSPVPEGTYICKLTVHNIHGSFSMNNRMIVVR